MIDLIAPSGGLSNSLVSAAGTAVKLMFLMFA